jgi:hypothetical protein
MELARAWYEETAELSIRYGMGQDTRFRDFKYS